MSTRLTALACTGLATAALSLFGAAAGASAAGPQVDPPWSKTAKSPAAVGYTLYPRTGPGFAVSRPIGRSGGKQPAYLGVTVLRTSFNGRRVSVTVKTSRLKRPMALELGARGSA